MQRKQQLTLDSSANAAARRANRSANRRARQQFSADASVDASIADAPTTTTAQVSSAMHPVLHAIDPVAAAALEIPAPFRMLKEVIDTCKELIRALNEAMKLREKVHADVHAVNRAWQSATTMVGEYMNMLQTTDNPDEAVVREAKLAINAELDTVMELHRLLLAGIQEGDALEEQCAEILVETAKKVDPLYSDPMFRHDDEQNDLQELEAVFEKVNNVRAAYEVAKQAAMSIKIAIDPNPEIARQKVNELRRQIRLAEAISTSQQLLRSGLATRRGQVDSAHDAAHAAGGSRAKRAI